MLKSGRTTHHTPGIERVRLNDLPRALHALRLVHHDGRDRLPFGPRQGEVRGGGERRPSEFWLSPSRSNTAQAIPCISMEKRQSRNAFMSSMALEPHSAAALCMARALCPAVI